MKTKAKSKSKAKALGSEIPETAKIKVIGDNPRRKGSGPHKMYERMRGGRTVASYIKAGGTRRWLPGAVKRKFIAISK